MHMMLQHTVRLLLFMSCLQKQCMLDPDVEHLHIGHVIRASVVHVPIVPKSMQNGMQQTRKGGHAENDGK